MSRYNPVWPSVKPWKLDYRSVIGVKPIKGVDYWTEKDQKEIVDEAVRRVEESSGNVSIIEMLIAADLLPAVTTASGAILTNNSGNVILRY